AETYNIYNYRQLPPTLVAVFSLGLRENSRIKLKLSRQTVPFETMLLAGIYDRLSMLVWFQTKDGQKGRNRPQMLTNLLTNTKQENDVEAFHSGEEFEKARKRLGGE
ncbi:hypothetical protein F3H09_30520, partial [Pseudomonas aeruginosa]